MEKSIEHAIKHIRNREYWKAINLLESLELSAEPLIAAVQAIAYIKVGMALNESEQFEKAILETVRLIGIIEAINRHGTIVLFSDEFRFVEYNEMAYFELYYHFKINNQNELSTGLIPIDINGKVIHKITREALCLK